MSVQPPSSLDDVGSLSAVPTELRLLYEARRASLPILNTIIFPPSLWHQLSAEGTNLFSHQNVLYDWHHAYAQLKSDWVRIGYCSINEIQWLTYVKGDNALFHQLNLLHTQAKPRIPFWVIVQVAPEALAHGTLSTRHQSLGTPGIVHITGLPGLPHQTVDEETAAELLLRSSDLNMLGESQSSAHYAADFHRHGKIILQPFDQEFVLPRTTLAKVAHDVMKFKRSQPEHLLCHWLQTGPNQIFFSEISTFLVDLPQRSSETNCLRTQVLLATGSPGELNLTQQVSTNGIGMLRSDYLWSQLDHHPLWLFEKRRKELQSHIRKYLQQASAAQPTGRILYRLQNLTSEELRQMKHGEDFEDAEKNPYLGHRGASWYLSHSDFFAFELEILMEWAKKRPAATGLIVPFVRDATQWRRIIAHLEKMKAFDYPLFELWLQLNTPANITQLDSYILPQLKGVIVHLKTVTALAAGIDPDDEVLRLEYPISSGVLSQTLSHVSTQLQNSAKHIIKTVFFEEYDPYLLELLVRLRYDGIIVSPPMLPIVKENLLQYETKQLEQEQATWH